MTDDGLTAWQRAGGYPREEWATVLRWAVRKHVAAEMARHDAPNIWESEHDVAKAESLRVDEERWDKLYRGVMAGDPVIFHEVHKMWLRETGQLDPR